MAMALMATQVLAQVRPSSEAPPPPPTGEARPAGPQGDVQITLRPVGDGRFEVYIDGVRVEGRVGERLLRVLQEQRGEGMRRPTPGDAGGAGAGPGDRPMRGNRGAPGEDGPLGDRPPGPPGTDRAQSQEDEMLAFRQRVGQIFEGTVPELTDDLLNEVMAVIKDFDEALYTRLSAAMETNPQIVRTRIQNDLRRWMAAVELKRHDPELYKLNVEDRQYSHETSRLAGEYAAAVRQGDSAKVESIKAEMEKLVGEHFDVRQKLRERDLAQLEQRLEFLRKQVQQRLERRAEIIREHLSQLFGGPQEDF